MLWNTIILGLTFGIHLSAHAQAPPRETVAKVIQQNPLSQRRLSESSGLVASPSQPGVLWTLNDSGNPPELFATDMAGKNLGVYTIRRAANRDWEALAVAPCGDDACLYAGDVGDNSARRAEVTIYRVREPQVRDSAVAEEIEPQAVLILTYPDGPQDVEAMFVTASGRIFLISKGRMNQPKLYYLDLAIGDKGFLQGTAQLAQQVDIPTTTGLAYQVTDAALAGDGRLVAVRTYRYIYFFRLDGHRFFTDLSRARCDATGVDAQGEAITWLANGHLATTSERLLNAGGTITELEC